MHLVECLTKARCNTDVFRLLLRMGFGDLVAKVKKCVGLGMSVGDLVVTG